MGTDISGILIIWGILLLVCVWLPVMATLAERVEGTLRGHKTRQRKSKTPLAHTHTAEVVPAGWFSYAKLKCTQCSTEFDPWTGI